MHKEKDLFESEIKKITSDVIIKTNDIMKDFPPDKYVLVSPAYPFRIKVAKTPVDLTVSAVFRTKNQQTIHYIDFTPWGSSHDIYWDPIMHLKLFHMKHFLKKHSSRKHLAIAHVYSMSKWNNSIDIHKNLITDSAIDDNLLQKIKSIIQTMETGYHYPKMPCNDTSCAFRRQCKPDNMF